MQLVCTCTLATTCLTQFSVENHFCVFSLRVAVLVVRVACGCVVDFEKYLTSNRTLVHVLKEQKRGLKRRDRRSQKRDRQAGGFGKRRHAGCRAVMCCHCSCLSFTEGGRVGGRKGSPPGDVYTRTVDSVIAGTDTLTCSQVRV
jgi:hypothetical protein